LRSQEGVDLGQGGVKNIKMLIENDYNVAPNPSTPIMDGITGRKHTALI
jgi:hypothetical protein